MKIKGLGTAKLERISGSRVAKGKGRGRSSAAGGARQDGVEFSEEARLSGLANEVINQAPEIRTELVEPIKEALDAGDYSVSSLDVADRILRQVLKERKRSF
ncbi:MAG: flagellar biosynthesis anti-sigma factor FlgM [Magnetococcales bacterium]|nr:flagellar biosynthesis anti-sigma factor FlgM [Magnetococcales bacterium]